MGTMYEVWDWLYSGKTTLATLTADPGDVVPVRRGQGAYMQE